MVKEINFEKLNGRSNYLTWEKKMLSFLRTVDLYKCVQPGPKTETDEDKLSRATGWLFLACEDHVTHHFNKDDTPLKIWESLKKTFSNTGQGLHLQAVMSLSRTNREDCESNDDYVGKMMEAWRRCTEVGIQFEDKIVALFMVGNLGTQFDSFRQSLVGSGQALTVDLVKKGLLELTPTQTIQSETAFYSESYQGKKRFSGSKRPKDLSHIKCFGCGQVGHYKSKCPGNSSGNKFNTKKKSVVKSADAKFAAAFSAIDGQRSDSDWFLDSGASRHMTPNKDILMDFQIISSPGISVADDRRLKVEGCGTAHLIVDGNDITLRNVLYVPELKANLLSLDVISRSGHRIDLDDGICQIFSKPDGNLIIKAKSSGGTFKVDAEHITCMLARDAELIEWHRKMGHIGYDGLKNLQKADSSIKFGGTRESISSCVSCAEGKQPRAAFHKKDVEVKTSNILELIHTDVCGPMSMSLGGARYFSVFVDDYSRKVFVSFLQEKSAVVGAFRHFKAMMENQTNLKIKRLRSDNGTEFVNKEMEDICAKSGIIHETTIPYTPQQNGVSERMNRTLVERARCMLSDGDLDKKLWAEAIHHAAYLVNRSVNRSVGYKTPEEIWSGQKPDLSSLKIFGNPAMIQIPKVKRSKWDPKAIEVQFVGYADTQKGLRFYDPKSKKVIVSRDVTFLNEKPMKSGTFSCDINNDGEEGRKVSDNTSKSTEVEKAKETGGPERTHENGGGNSVDESPSIDDGRLIKIESDDSIESQESETSYRSDTTVESFQDATSDPEYVPLGANVSTPVERRRSSRIPRPKVRDGYVSYFTRDCDMEDPLTREEAVNAHDGEQWIMAMEEELASFQENGTWSLVDLPENRKPIRTMWVFKRKRADDGTVIRHKARLVAKGCSQRFGIDYRETFSPVVRYESIRILIALAARRRMNIDQMDAVTAYLQGDLDEDIYTMQPDGFEDGSSKVCKLKKAMYGLRQSGRCWNECLDNALKSFGLKRSAEDPCVYNNDDSSLIIAIYVDDFLIFWNDTKIRDELKAKLSHTFYMKDLGRARTCVGLTIEYEKDVISINQSIYANEILKRFGMENCKPASSPCDLSQRLTVKSNGTEIDVPYREAVGSLLFLVPDPIWLLRSAT